MTRKKINDETFVPSKYQKRIFDFVENGQGNAVIEAQAGSGKCLGRDTKVLMFDGTVKNVQDIVKGDLLMGDDSTKRTVLSTTVGHGRLREIRPSIGDKWVCNDAHILTLLKDNEIIDIPIGEVETNEKDGNDYYKSFMLVRTGVDFPKKDIPESLCNPYYLSLVGALSVLRQDDDLIKDYHLHNTREIRLNVLNGIVKPYGHNIATTSEALSEKILYLSRSLGIPAYSVVDGDGLIHITVGEYVCGGQQEYVQFSIKDIGEGEYYGFTLDGNGRFLLGDFTVTHNTSTAMRCISLIPSGKKILLTAFNNSIVDELRKKITSCPNKKDIDCRTMHSLGYSMLISNFRGKINKEMDEFKYSSYIYNNIDDLGGDIYAALPKKDRSKYVDNIRKLVDFGRCYLVDTVKGMEFIEDHYKITTLGNEKEAALEVMKWGKKNYGTIDFTDMVWLPNVLNCKPYKHIYDWIIVDESQDISKAERELLLRCTKMSTRMLFWGQEIQCQPIGTRILMSDSSEKKIEDICVGDSVITYDEYNGVCDNGKVMNVEHHNENRIIKITTSDGHVSSYSPEHKCYVSINVNTFCSYFAENTNGEFFFGYGTVFDEKHDIIFSGMKIGGHYIDKAWIADTYVCPEETDIPLECRILSILGPQPLRDEQLTDKMEDCEKGRETAFGLMKQYHAEYDKPFYERDAEHIEGKRHLYTTSACNLRANAMSVYVHGKGGLSVIESIDYSECDTEVYSLEISGNHNYFGDGILTHNCIYSFQGSDYMSFKELKKLPNTVSLPLSISYRCPKKVVRLANRFAPDMEAKEDAIDGEVAYNVDISDISDGDMVLCRNNAPLLQLYCELYKLGKPSYICGKDIGTNLIGIIRKTKEKELNKSLLKSGLFSKLYNNLFNDIDTKMKKSNISFEMALDDISISQEYDTIQALEAISDSCNDTECLIDRISSLFSDEKLKGITLSTIHKAKGLEADNVYICCPSLLPSRSAKEPWEIKQEANLEYVAYTRAKKKLCFLNEDKFSSYSSTAQQKSKNLIKKRDMVFAIYGDRSRCSAVVPSPKAAKQIIANSTKIERKVSNSVDISGNGKKAAQSMSFLGTVPKKRIKRRINI